VGRVFGAELEPAAGLGLYGTSSSSRRLETVYPSAKPRRIPTNGSPAVARYALGAAVNAGSTRPYIVPAPSSSNTNQARLRTTAVIPVMIRSISGTTIAAEPFV
jgi:hypothetical protein